MQKDSAIFGGDERLKKSAGSAVRGSRDEADAERTQLDGTALSAEERRRALRRDWVQEVLPTAPELPGFHLCWLSTTNSVDSIYSRTRKGYVPVKQTELPGFGAHFGVTGGQYDGCIACNEMILFKIPLELYNDVMTINHHDMPMEQESAIYEKIRGTEEYDRGGRRQGMVAEDDFNSLGRKVQTPTFV